MREVADWRVSLADGNLACATAFGVRVACPAFGRSGRAESAGGPGNGSPPAAPLAGHVPARRPNLPPEQDDDKLHSGGSRTEMLDRSTPHPLMSIFSWFKKKAFGVVLQDFGFNRGVPWAGSLSLGREAS